MRYYETLYIVNPNHEQDRLDSIMAEVNKVFEEAGVTTVNHRVWSKKRLAYPIQKHKYGTYMLLQFETDKQKFLLDFNAFMKLDKAIIRHQTVRLDSKPEVYEEETKSSSNETEEKSGADVDKDSQEDAAASDSAPESDETEVGKKEIKPDLDNPEEEKEG